MKNSDNSYAILNKSQQEAVFADDTPMIIFAGAGSGKTRVLTYRINHLIKSGVPANSILAITFTNKAAREMAERIDNVVSGRQKPTIGTFHSVCARILRENAQRLGYSSRFVIFDGADQKSMIKKIIKELELSESFYKPSMLVSIYSKYRRNMIDIESIDVTSHYTAGRIKIFKRYESLKKESDGMDFDDLMLNVVRLFEENPDLLKFYRERFRHLFVDEFQDTNAIQYRLIRLLAEKYRSICVVGDDDQSIYRFRGADSKNIELFMKDFPDAAIFKLEQNYRSTKAILEFAHKVISKNSHRTDKQLWTENPEGEPIDFIRVGSDRDEAKKVLSIIEKEHGRGRNYSDIAVFYRMNSQSRIIELELTGVVPYKIVKGHRFYDRREIKDIISYMQLVLNRNNNVCFERIVNVPSRKVGKKTIELLREEALKNGCSLFDAAKLFLKKRKNAGLDSFIGLIEKAEKIGSIVELFDYLIEQSGYMDMLKNEGGTVSENRISNILELKNAIVEHSKKEDGSLEAFLELTALTDDSNDISEDNVNLMTLHASKGLEFPVVIIVGTDDGIIPHSNAFSDPEQLQEERRLFYVGITRAKEKLYILSAASRMIAGSLSGFAPSRFAREHFKENNYFYFGGENGESIRKYW